MSAKLPTSGKGSYLFQRSETHKHRGVDLGAPEGAPIYAAAEGIVRFSTNAWRQGFTGYGRVVVVESPDGFFQLYAHNEESLAPVGARVRAGEQIATVGRTTYNSDNHESLGIGPHLHFEVARRSYPMPSEAERVDPVKWLIERDAVHPLSGQPARLATVLPPGVKLDEGSPVGEPPLAQPRQASFFLRCSAPCPSCSSLLVVVVDGDAAVRVSTEKV